MPIGLIGGLVSGASSLFGAISAGNAADKQSAAANRAIGLQEQQYADIARKLAPFLDMGTNAWQALGELFGITFKEGQQTTGPFNAPVSSVVGAPPSPNAPGADFQASPGYQFQLDQAMNAVQNSAANKTGAVSGNMMRALQGTATGLANQDYWKWYQGLNQNYASRYGDEQGRRNQIVAVLQALAGSGQNAAVNQGTFGQNAASNIGALGAYGANAQAAGILGQSNAIGNMFSNPGFMNAITGMFGGSSSGGSGDYGGVAGGNPYAGGGYYGSGVLF